MRKNKAKLLPHRSDARLASLIATQILPTLTGINSILDIGCGDGVVGDLIPKECNYQGIDLSNASIYRQNTEDPRITYSQPDYLKTTLQQSQKADAVLMLDVLEHTPGFTELFELSLPQAKNYVLVSLPNELFLVDRLKFILGKEHPAHSLDLIKLPVGFKHQYLINTSKARHILSEIAEKHGFTLKEEWHRPLRSKNKLFQPGLWLIRQFSSFNLWSMGSVFIFKRIIP